LSDDELKRDDFQFVVQVHANEVLDLEVIMDNIHRRSLRLPLCQAPINRE
jgi:hypothetical protein